MPRPEVDDSPKVLLIGVGGLGTMILEFLARAPGRRSIVPAGRDSDRNTARGNLATIGAVAQGYPPPEITCVPLELRDEEARFWPRFRVPTVALNDPTYRPTTMGRGPVWPNINYLLITALNRGGYPDMARRLQQRTLELAMGNDDLIEYYNPETGGRPPRAASTFSWSAAVFIDLAIAATRAASQSPRPAESKYYAGADTD